MLFLLRSLGWGSVNKFLNNCTLKSIVATSTPTRSIEIGLTLLGLSYFSNDLIVNLMSMSDFLHRLYTDFSPSSLQPTTRRLTLFQDKLLQVTDFDESMLSVEEERGGCE